MKQLIPSYDLPNVRGSYRYNADLSKTNWFGVGGMADILFKPADIDDLSFFIKNKPKNLPYIVLGVGSNLLIRDAGFRGVVIKLGREFSNISIKDNIISAGASALDYNVSLFAMDNDIGGMEFLSGIPGTIGGAVAMNAGAYGSDISNILVSATYIDEFGDIKTANNLEIGYYYRGSNLAKSGNNIFVSAELKGYSDLQENISKKMEDIKNSRTSTQPIKSKTSGSTFKNPQGYKAWQLIDDVGMRGYRLGGAMISDMHCNFFINDDGAKAKDIEDLGNLVIDKVYQKYGIKLEWEVKIIGDEK